MEKFRELRKGGFLITKIHQLMLRIFDKLLEEHDINEITTAQGRVMFPIWREDNISFKDLKKKTMLSKATLSYMLDKLEEAGHVERVRSEVDKRTIYIKLTKKNKELQDKYVQVSLAMKDLFYTGFSEKEIDELESYLRRLLDNLTNYKEKNRN